MPLKRSFRWHKSGSYTRYIQIYPDISINRGGGGGRDKYKNSYTMFMMIMVMVLMIMNEWMNVSVFSDVPALGCQI